MKRFYPAIVLKVHDGDTVTVSLDLGFSTWRHETAIRLAKINSPELKTDAGKNARDYLREILPIDTPVIVETIQEKQELYNRYVCIIWLNEQAMATGFPGSVNQTMISSGHAEAWSEKK